jgi:gamma-glutamyltranspeptidase/glutathione hydrolase
LKFALDWGLIVLKFYSLGLVVGVLCLAATTSVWGLQTGVGPTTILKSTTGVLPGSSESTSRKNMVASVHPLATQAGVDAFAQGGNAIDAAIATALTLGVVDNFNSGIGGGCFILIRTAKGEVYAIDGREMAPSAATQDLFQNAKGRFANPSQTGALASGVPGALQAYAQAVAEHGRLGLSASLQKGMEAAENGFPVTDAYAGKLRIAKKAMVQFPGAVKVFFRPDPTTGIVEPYRVGEILKQSDLATTYRMISQKGTDWFYRGAFAELADQWMKANGGIMTATDFANYKTVNRKPVRSKYRDFEIYGFPPPSSGGVHVAQVLNILEQFKMAEMYQNDPVAFYHVVAEAMKLAFADRAFWLGDPDYVEVPLGLIEKSYAKELASKIKMDSVLTTDHGMPPNAATEFFERHTTHVAAADSEGNWVALTTTVNTTFGAKYVIPGTGVVMNNQMDDFVAFPGKPNAFGLIGGENNAVASGKRPLSSMSPTIVLQDGKPILTVGAAGGPKIITEVLWAIINHLDLEMPIGKAIAAPRLHHQWAPKQLLLESSFDDEIADQLAAKQHQIKRSRSMGICQGITFDAETGLFTGAYDPRTTGSAAGEQ